MTAVRERELAPSPWHTMPVEDCLEALGTDLDGLREEEAASRLDRYGPNELAASRRVSPWRILLEQFQNTLILILLVAVAISAGLGHQVEAIAIGVIVLFAAGLGFIQEFRAERSMEALREMAAPTATVLRGGEEVELPARQLVPGDIVLLSPGDRVPADARVVESVNLRADEAALTGESVPVGKRTEALADPTAALGDRISMLFAGTAVVYGRGRGVVTGTGMATEFGKVASLLQTVETARTPLQENLAHVGKVLARAAFAVVGLIVVAGLLRGQPVIDMLLFGVALAVAVVPEALPAVVTISLAIGVQRMVRRNALVRRLPAVETLGSTSVICSDKTGTLTRDQMTIRKVHAGGRTFDVLGSGYEPVGEFQSEGATVAATPALKHMLSAAVLDSDAHLSQNKETGRWHVKGDPTEGAILVAAEKAGLHKADLDRRFPRVGEIPFTSETKRMTTLHTVDGETVAYAKGAPEVILAACESEWTEEGTAQPLSESRREELLGLARELASRALRVIAVAEHHEATTENAESALTFLGMVGMIDPPRPEVRDALRVCENAGIRVKMITGDHPITAEAVARELGILQGGRVMTAAELDRLSDEELKEQVEGIDVFARVSPADKLRVVTALQDRGHIAAMTGDGVNDAPALKRAAIGIAMGITGTDVTKEAAVMTLTDDNFASIVAAVEEGRAIFENIKKYLMYLLSSNIGEIVLMAAATLLGMPLPLTAVMLLYVNLATDGLPALALAVDPHENDLMRHPPRHVGSGIFTRPVIVLMIVGGLWSALVNLGLFAWALHSGQSQQEAMSLTFISLVLIQFFKAYNFRSDRQSVLVRPFANHWLNLAIAWEVLLLVLIIYVPFLNRPFNTTPLPARDWLIALVLASSVCPVLELAKWMERREWFGKLEG